MSGRGPVQGEKTMGDSVKNTQRNGSAKRIARLGLLPLIVFALVGCIASASAAADEPIYTIKALWGDTYLPPGGEGQFVLKAQNVGTADGVGPDDDHRSAARRGDGEEHRIRSSRMGNRRSSLPLHGSRHRNAQLRIPRRRSQCGANLAHSASSASLPSGFLTPDLRQRRSLAERERHRHQRRHPERRRLRRHGNRHRSGHLQLDAFELRDRAGQLRGRCLRRRVPRSTALSPSRCPSPRAAGRLRPERGKRTLKASRYTLPHGRIRDAVVTLPRGFIGNPEAMPKCDPADFAVVGVSRQCDPMPARHPGRLPQRLLRQRQEPAWLWRLSAYDPLTHVAIYNLVPPHGQVADLAFNAGGFRPGPHLPDPRPGAELRGEDGLAGHLGPALGQGRRNEDLGRAGRSGARSLPLLHRPLAKHPGVGAPWGSAPIRPFLTNPMDCGFDNGGSRIRVDSWNDPATSPPPRSSKNPLNVTRLRRPALPLQPEGRRAADLKGRRRADRAGGEARSAAAKRRSKRREQALRRKRRRAGDPDPAAEESGAHLPRGDDGLTLGGPGPRGLQLRSRSGSAPTRRSPAPINRNWAR